jgi:type IV secretion system protein VirB9
MSALGHRGLLGLAILAVGIVGWLDGQRALAEQVPLRGLIDPRVRTAVYDAAQVYRLQGFPGYALHLEFAAGEVFEGLGAGDIEAVSVVAEGNHLFLKPKASPVATNLTLLTNRHTYLIDYRVSARHAIPEREELIFSVKFLYPGDTAEAAALAVAARRVSEALATPAAPLNRRYGFCGPKTLRPIEAFDDGVQTRLKFPPRVDLPAIFVRNEDGTEALVNFTVEGEGVVLHRVAKAFVLRRGHLTGCIVNEAFAGGGAALSSGTVSPTVERAAQGNGP